MQSNDSIIAPCGKFILTAFRHGVLVPELCMDEQNLIVANSKAIHAHLLGGDVANRSVTTIGFGTNGAAATTSDTSLTGSFTKAVDQVSYPTVGLVQFDFSLAAGEANGLAILEFGLLTGTPALYARKVRSVALNKTADLSFSGTWTITF